MNLLKLVPTLELDPQTMQSRNIPLQCLKGKSKCQFHKDSNTDTRQSNFPHIPVYHSFCKYWQNIVGFSLIRELS
jgi:hypothetical protein